MKINTRRRYFNKFATMMAAVTGAPILFAQQPPAGAAPAAGPAGGARRNNHIQQWNLLFLRHWFQRRLSQGRSRSRHRPLREARHPNHGRPEEVGGTRRLHHGQHPPCGGFYLPAARRRCPDADRESALRCAQSAVRCVEQNLRDLLQPRQSSLPRLHGCRVDSRRFADRNRW